MGDFLRMYQVILVTSLLSLGAGAPYVPGNPGASWTLDEMLIMKSKFFTMFGRMNNAPKHLRLGFHDCIKYADGSGGCDGCLNWKGMDQILDIVQGARNLSVEAGGGNNGLGKTVRNLERSFQFQTGRSDCTEHDEEFPYKATKEEKHPSATDAGRKTVEYFRTEFPDLTG